MAAPVIVVSSANGNVGMDAAVEVLRSGGTALEAAEAGCRVVEDNVEDHTVGTGGYPNLSGVVELDASIMDGTTRAAGAVAALQNFPHAISVARALMERMPQHILLVGDGAAKFARECGFAHANILTDEARDAWRDRIAGVKLTARTSDNAAGGGTLEEEQDLIALASSMIDPQRTAGTVNFLVRDARGRIASAVTTSGWAFKYPGRVGDSALIGSGNYCDDRYGACACTGLGEWAIRSATARLVVAGIQNGASLDDACAAAIRDLADLPLPPGLQAAMNLIAMDAQGSHSGYSTAPGRTYIFQTPEMSAYDEVARQVVAV